MSLTLSDMRKRVRKGLGGLDSTEMPNDEVDELLNMALWELDNRFTFEEKECIVTTTTTDGQRSYEIPNNLDAIQSISVDGEGGDDDKKSYKLLRMTEHTLDELRDQEADAKGFPEKYVRINDGIYLEPIPDDEYTLRIFMWRTIASLVEGSVETPNLPRNWHELVVEGAIIRGHYYNQDYNLAQQAASITIGKERAAVETKAKEERDSRYAGLDVQHKAPDGRH